MPFVISYGIAIIGALVAYLLSKGKTRRRKYITWGIILMLIISPFLSYGMGLTYAVIERSGWALLMTLYIFPIFFIVGLILLLVGVFKKDETGKYGTPNEYKS